VHSYFLYLSLWLSIYAAYLANAYLTRLGSQYTDLLVNVCSNMILRQLAPQLHIPYCVTYQPEDIPIVPTMYGTM